MINRVNIPTQHILKPQVTQNVQQPTVSESTKQFSTFLKDAISSVNNAQIKSDTLTTKMALGENVDLHNVMIESQKASVSLQATLEIRNKVIEAYQEVMRMQI
ncbi:flagellar hook-basal body complex protein FliE [Bacillus sp. HMF5848]|uniref:flagellar hook-basal body complex protein FliE n=1 Tax=Bacillus sp. HMF5848 TaxID=2495421 RepID=UPI000F76A7EA|nr:flagellar hook-basal body complex protein FliE [Bacillus sp. HMF5848]RSK27024.1 flagellar hook-basal body complex protein FliE [Bacillus sp. HMF5848]